MFKLTVLMKIDFPWSFKPTVHLERIATDFREKRISPYDSFIHISSNMCVVLAYLAATG